MAKIKNSKRIQKVLIIVLLLIPLISYVLKFGGTSLSDNPQDWGVFGDYVGGVYSILVSILAIFLARIIDRKDSEAKSRKDAIQKINKQILLIKNNHYNRKSVSKLLRLISEYQIFLPKELYDRLKQLYDYYLLKNEDKQCVYSQLESIILQELKQLYNA